MQRLIAIILFIISFFTTGDLTKANVSAAKEIKSGDTSAVFVFENETGKRIDGEIVIEDIEKEVLGQWISVPFSQSYLENDRSEPVYPTEKRSLYVDFQSTISDIPIQIPITSGSYRITVTFKTNGYRSVQDGKVTSAFTVVS